MSPAEKKRSEIACKGWRASLRHARRVDPVVGCLKAIWKVPDGEVIKPLYIECFAIGWFRRMGRSYARAVDLSNKVAARIESGWQPPPPRKPRRRSPGRAAVTGRRLKVA
jgi:hypothetical protein